jgi:streptogramin lyase
MSPKDLPPNCVFNALHQDDIAERHEREIVRVDPATRLVRRFPLPSSSGYANLNTLPSFGSSRP